jgi:hypothetical protein
VLPAHDHVRQAFDGWMRQGSWVRINPSPAYMIAVDPALQGRPDLPDLAPRQAPADWTDAASYTVPEGIPDGIYQTAAVWQMCDRLVRRAADPGDNGSR